MYNNSYNYPLYNNQYYQSYANANNDRIVTGGFLAPFLLGGIAGAALSPGFGFGYNRPIYYTNYYPYPYQYYRPYPRYYYY